MKQIIKNTFKILFKVIMVYFIIAGIIFTLNLPVKEKNIPDKTVKQMEEFISEIKVNIDYEPEMGYKYLTSFRNSMLENMDVKKIADVSSESGNLYEKSVIYNYLYKILEKYDWNNKISEDFHLDMSKIWAFSYDLNDDGVDEILGYYQNKLFCDSKGCQFFILKKQNDRYIDIYRNSIMAEKSRIIILKSKHYKFSNIIFAPWQFPPGDLPLDVLVYDKMD